MKLKKNRKIQEFGIWSPEQKARDMESTVKRHRKVEKS